MSSIVLSRFPPTPIYGCLRRLGERIVVSHLDLISYEIPGYFPSFEKWQAYRRVTRQALAYADRVIFISSAAAQDAVRQDLIEAHHFDVVYPGTDHRLAALSPGPTPPDGLEHRAAPFLLCIGTDYRHGTECSRFECSNNSSSTMAQPELSSSPVRTCRSALRPVKRRSSSRCDQRWPEQ